MKIAIQVVFELPEGATPGDAADYVEAAVRNWHGCLQPPDGSDDTGDPMYLLDPRTVTVTMWTNDQIKELATYGAQERLKELDAQRVKIDEERETLMQFLNGGAEPKAPVPATSSARRKAMSPEARQAASLRMKKIWAKRRKAKKDAAKAAEAAAATSEPLMPETQSDTPPAS